MKRGGGGNTDVVAFNGCFGGAETEADVFVPSPSAFADAAGGFGGFVFGVEEDVGLLLEGALGLYG